MKTLIVIVSGASDRPLEELGGRTPLEAASTPALDRIAIEGRLGRLAVAPAKMRPEEGAFVLGVFGLDPASYGDVGATLDAAALDVPVGSLDQAFRLALVTGDRGTIFDPAVGNLRREEAALLLDELSEALADSDLTLHAGPNGHHLLLWKGARDVRVKTMPPYEVVGKDLQASLPRGTGIGRLLAAIERSVDVLDAHEVNELRRDLGENPATMVWPWAPGVTTQLPNFHTRTAVPAVAVGVQAAFLGAAKLQGIATQTPEGATGQLDSNLRAKTRAAIDALETADLAVLHVDALAAASHRRDFVAKVEALERIDGYVVGQALRALEEGPSLRLVVIGGPAVSAESGRVLNDPVPFAIFGHHIRGHRKGRFTEVAARESGFQVDRTHELMDFLLHLPG